MPEALPPDRLNSDDYHVAADVHAILPLRRGGRLHALQHEIVQRAPGLMAHRHSDRSDVPITDPWRFVCCSAYRNLDRRRGEDRCNRSHEALPFNVFSLRGGMCQYLQPSEPARRRAQPPRADFSDALVHHNLRLPS